MPSFLVLLNVRSFVDLTIAKNHFDYMYSFNNSTMKMDCSPFSLSFQERIDNLAMTMEVLAEEKHSNTGVSIFLWLVTTVLKHSPFLSFFFAVFVYCSVCMCGFKSSGLYYFNTNKILLMAVFLFLSPIYFLLKIYCTVFTIHSS